MYKLSALRDSAGQWSYRLKLSEHGSKQSDPGILQVRRLRSADGRCVADVIYDEPAGLPDPPALVPLGAQEARPAPEHAQQADLLVPVFRGGRAVYEPPPAAEARDRVAAELASFDGAVLENLAPRSYLVGLEAGLHKLKNGLAAAARAAERGG